MANELYWVILIVGLTMQVTSFVAIISIWYNTTKLKAIHYELHNIAQNTWRMTNIMQK